MKITHIKETCLYTKDLDLAIDFYHKKLEFPIIRYVKDKHVFFRVGFSVLLCFNPEHAKAKSHPPPHYAYGKQHIAFEVHPDDYETSKAKIRQLGITITDEVVWETGQESFYFEDTSGNLLEIVPKGIWSD